MIGLIGSRGFLYGILETAHIALSTGIVNPSVCVTSGSKSIHITVRACCIRISTPEGTRSTGDLSIRITRVIVVTRHKTGNITTADGRYLRGGLPERIRGLYTIMRTASGIGICGGYQGFGRMGGSHITNLTGKPHASPTAVVFLIGGEDRVSFAVEDTVTGQFRVYLVAVSKGRTGYIIQHIHRITGDSVRPRGTIAFTGAIRRDIDDRTADRQVGIFQRTYIRLAAIVTAGIIRQIEIFCIRTRHIVSSIRRD